MQISSKVKGKVDGLADFPNTNGVGLLGGPNWPAWSGGPVDPEVARVCSSSSNCFGEPFPTTIADVDIGAVNTGSHGGFELSF